MNPNRRIIIAAIFALLSLMAPAPAAPDQPTLKYKLSVTPEIKKAFQGADGIEIREVTGTRPGFEARGTYRVIGTCRMETLRKAMLYLGNTAEAGPAAIVPAPGSSLSTPLTEATQGFDITFTVRRPGRLHVTIYDEESRNPTNNAHAGIYLGLASGK